MTQTYAFTFKHDHFVVTSQFQGFNLHIAKCIGIFGVKISRKVQFGNHLVRKGKSSQKKAKILTHFIEVCYIQT